MCAGEVHRIHDQTSPISEPCQVADPRPTLVGERAQRATLSRKLHRTHAPSTRLSPEGIGCDGSTVRRPGNSVNAKERRTLTLCEYSLAAAILICYHQSTVVRL